MALIEIENLSLGYEGKRVAEHISFSLKEGDCLCIVGENGSGKSTLIKTILGLLPAIEGSIIYGNEFKLNQIGYLPQQTDVQKDFPATVFEIVLSGCAGRVGMRPFYNQEEKKLAGANIDRLGITELSKRCYRELSGGQQQRVLLARALCATQKVLLLDEPVAGLDPKATESLYQLIEQLNKESGLTIIMVSHDVDASLLYATHVLDIGTEEVFFGTKADFVQRSGGDA